MAAESYLVTGGCGFQGSDIVEALRERYPSAAVAVLTRNPTTNVFPGVAYHKGDITNPDDIAACLAASKPSVIFHCAAAMVIGRKPVSEEAVKAINIEGTRFLLEGTRRLNGTVKAFVYTSSAGVVQRSMFSDINGADETWPTAEFTDPTFIYPQTKAAGERVVLAADDPNGSKEFHRLRTCAIRPAAIYGERDNDITPGMMRILRAGNPGLQIGNNDNRFSTTYVRNSTDAHLLAAEKLLAGDDRVGGEAFFATNDDKEAHTFFDFMRELWKHAGFEAKPEQIRVIPVWLALSVGYVMEWWAWAWGIQPKLTRQTIRMSTMARWYRIDKAKNVLGYEPKVHWREGCRRSAKKEKAESSK